MSRKRYKIDTNFLLKSNRKSYALYRMVTLPMTLSAPKPPQTTPFSAFCTAIHSFVTGEPRDFIFGSLTYHSQVPPCRRKIFPERGVVRVRRTVLKFYTPCNFSATANARDFKFCTQVGHVKCQSCDDRVFPKWA